MFKLARKLSILCLLPTIACALTIALLSLFSTPAAALVPCQATHDNGTTVRTSVQQAVDDASPGETVKVAGRCTGVSLRDNSNQHAIITKSLTIQGGYPLGGPWTTSNPAANPTILDALAGGTVLVFRGASGAVSNLTVQNGLSGAGAGISATNSLALTNVNVLSNTAGIDAGGAFIFAGGSLSGGLFRNNKANGGSGGALNTALAPSISGTRFIANSASSNGGAIVMGNAYITNAQFLSNTAAFFGGGAYLPFGDSSIVGTLFQNNSVSDALGEGGGLFGGVLSLSGTAFISNSASYAGGALVLNSGAGVIAHTAFTRNSGGSFGGALFSDGGALTITESYFLNNSAISGAGIFQNSGPSARVVNSVFGGHGSSSGSTLYFGGSGSAITILYTTIASPTQAAGSAVVVGTGVTAGITDSIIASYTFGIRNFGATYEDYNLFYQLSSLNPDNAFVAGSGTHDITNDPLFKNPVIGDYHLQSGSPAIDQGADVGIYIDFDGDPRPTISGSRPRRPGISGGFDIGFDEFTGTPTAVTLAQVTTSVGGDALADGAPLLLLLLPAAFIAALGWGRLRQRRR